MVAPERYSAGSETAAATVLPVPERAVPAGSAATGSDNTGRFPYIPESTFQFQLFKRYFCIGLEEENWARFT